MQNQHSKLSSSELSDEVEDPSHRNPFLFVTGCGRSGTTLLQRMLNSHPELAVANDTHFILRAIQVNAPWAMVATGEDADPILSTALVDWVRSYHRFRYLGVTDEAVSAAQEGQRTFTQFVSALYTHFASLHGKQLGGEKTPDYGRNLPVLHRLFPWAKSIHIIRDGRDVALSALDWAHEKKGPGRFPLWQEHPVAVCALWWCWNVSTGQRDGPNLNPGSYYEVRYEDLVARPEETLCPMMEFLGLPYADSMLTFYEGKTRDVPGLSAKKAWLPPTPGLRDWRSQMPGPDAELFEALAGDLLTELGYQRSFDRISSKTAELAAECLSWWQAEMLRRQEKFDRRVAACRVGDATSTGADH